MTVQSKTLRGAERSSALGLGRYNVMHAGAVVLHALSYLTTLWFVQWVAPGLSLRAAGLVAWFLELTLFALKLALYARSPAGRGVGWAGVSADGLINMAGLVPMAPAILTFPPVAIVLALLGWLVGLAGLSLEIFGVPFHALPYGGGMVAVSASVLIVSLGGGMLLSAGPHRLWEAAERG